MSNTVTHETCPTCGTITVHNLAAYMDELNAEPDDPPVILHNGQPVNLDAILDLAAAQAAYFEWLDSGVKYRSADELKFTRAVETAYKALSSNDRACLAERREGR